MIISKFGPSLPPQELAHEPELGWLVRAQTRPCALVCAHTFILSSAFFKTLSKKNQKNPQSMWPIYMTFTLNTEKDDKQKVEEVFRGGVCSSGAGQFNLQHGADMKKEPSCWTGPGAGGQGRTGGGGGAVGVVLPGQLTHHLQQSLVLLFQLLVLVLNVVQVLPRQQKSGRTQDGDIRHAAEPKGAAN